MPPLLVSVRATYPRTSNPKQTDEAGGRQRHEPPAGRRVHGSPCGARGSGRPDESLLLGARSEPAFVKSPPYSPGEGRGVSPVVSGSGNREGSLTSHTLLQSGQRVTLPLFGAPAGDVLRQALCRSKALVAGWTRELCRRSSSFFPGLSSRGFKVLGGRGHLNDTYTGATPAGSMFCQPLLSSEGFAACRTAGGRQFWHGAH